MKKAYALAALLIFLNLQIRIQNHVENRRINVEGLKTHFLFQVGEAVNGILAGGFRGIAADLLWVRLDEYSHHGQWYKLLPLFKAVTFLQPQFITAWSVGGWHMAFNLYFYSKTDLEKKRWLEEGLKFLKSGLMQNSNRYELYFELGWTYFYKAKDYPNAIRYLRHGIKYEHPQFVEHLLAHAYEKNGELKEALNVWKDIQQRPTRNQVLDSVVNRFIHELGEKLKEKITP
ncbi:MAG: hypothetical protein HYS07_09150 [Chlamydiae bacterium]|nr:hypothetical protein [Chlamydiota bacterium]MBI3277703.1 hypothetical protein [Chlamydiota bacterium]